MGIKYIRLAGGFGLQPSKNLAIYQMNWPSPSGMSRNVLGANSSSSDGMRGHRPCSYPNRMAASIELRFGSIP